MPEEELFLLDHSPSTLRISRHEGRSFVTMEIYVGEGVVLLSHQNSIAACIADLRERIAVRRAA